MSTTIYYYTGTGNSLWVARTVAGELGDTELVYIPAVKEADKAPGAECLGLVFPVYMWGVPGPREELQKRFTAAREKISMIAAAVREKKKMPVEQGPLWQRLLFSRLLYPLSFPQVPSMDKSFRVDEKCNGCGTCQRVCPAGNITLVDGKPTWKHRCEQCFACLQWCPREAMQYGKNTPKYERYHHPEVSLKDILEPRQ